MNKNAILVFLVIVTILSGVFALFQKTEASRARYEAESNLMLAQQAKNLADQQKLEAEQNLIRAQKAEALAMANAKLAMQMQVDLAKCKGKK